MSRRRILSIAAPVGEHAEEHVKGPGLLLRGSPEEYLTIIRYRVKKAR